MGNHHHHEQPKEQLETVKTTVKLEISEEYETQIKIPKPILTRIFSEMGNDVLDVKSICKQTYFLLKSESFWEFYCIRNYGEKRLKEAAGNNNFEKFKSIYECWEKKRTHFSFKPKGNRIWINEKNISNFVTASTKLSFDYNEQNALFVFKLKYSCSDLVGMGVTCDFDYPLNKIIHTKTDYSVGM